MSNHGHSAKCGCGSVSVRLGKDIYSVFNCHCNDCRTHNGSAYTSYVVSSVDGFEITQGADVVASYHNDISTKHYCSQCGTPLFNTIETYPNIRLFYLGAVDHCEEFEPKMNVWCQTQLSWVNDIGDLTSYAQNSE